MNNKKYINLLLLEIIHFQKKYSIFRILCNRRCFKCLASIFDNKFLFGYNNIYKSLLFSGKQGLNYNKLSGIVHVKKNVKIKSFFCVCVCVFV